VDEPPCEPAAEDVEALDADDGAVLDSVGTTSGRAELVTSGAGVVGGFVGPTGAADVEPADGDEVADPARANARSTSELLNVDP
jgi:hypothetical protein